MATRAELRALARRQLGDEVAPYVWGDGLVNDALADACTEYGELFPARAVAQGAATPGVRAYTLPADARQALRVEFPAGRFLPRDDGIPAYQATGDAADDGLAQAWGWNPTTRQVTLRRAPVDGGTIRVHYLATRTLPADDTTAAPVPAADNLLLVLLACRALWEARRLEDAKRGLRTPGGGNPFGGRVEAMLARRRRARGRVMYDA
jgi:hypothetical protein